MKRFNLLLGVGIVAILVSLAVAAVPKLINFQGILKDGSGNPVTNGSYSVTFKIYAVPSGGTVLWTETQSVITSNGLFAVILGSSNPVPDTAFKGSDRWLGIAVSPDPEMPQRQQLVSVGYAYRVNSVDSALGGTIKTKLSIGPGHTNTGTDAFVAGANNQARGAYSVVSGGGGPTAADSNSASGEWATIGGGRKNTAKSFFSNDGSPTVSGGANNTAGFDYATVGGGKGNTASSIMATVGGGESNTASVSQATVGGGSGNTASNTAATVSGGNSNTASGYAATVGGGVFNIANGFRATVGGGQNNTASGDSSTIGGGYGNTASGVGATIGGGFINRANSNSATVGGGFNNTASGNKATIGGGINNRASNAVATVGGGELNEASGVKATVGGGGGNLASGDSSTAGGGGGNFATNRLATVSGGWLNEASGQFSAVGGGGGNEASGFGATVPGGINDTAFGTASLAAGNKAKALHDFSFIWSDGTVFSSTGTNQFLIHASGGVGIGTNSPAALLHVNGTAGNNTGVWSNLSDRRLKKDIEPIQNALETVNRLEPVSFRWKDSQKDAQFGRVRGLIAQVVEKVIPEWIKTDPDGYKRIEPIGIDALLIEAIKELKSKNDAGEETIARLEAQVNQLEELVQKLLAREENKSESNAKFGTAR